MSEITFKWEMWFDGFKHTLCSYYIMVQRALCQIKPKLRCNLCHVNNIHVTWVAPQFPTYSPSYNPNIQGS